EIYLGSTFNQGAIYSVLVSFSGATLALRTDELVGVADQAGFESAFVRHLDAFLAENQARLPAVKRIGLALPGQLDAEKRILKHYGLMPFIKDEDIGALVGSRLPNLPLITRHNVAGMARVFLKDRALAQGYGRILLVSARAGAAHALIQDGKVVLDQGEMGHLRVASSNKRCECGRIGCLDSIFSARELRLLFPGLSGPDLSKALADEAAAGGSVLRSRLEPSYVAFCEALLDLCAAFSPDLVLLSGELLALLPDPAAWIRRWIGGLIDLENPPAWFPGDMTYRPTGAEAAAIGLCYALIEEDWAWQTDHAEKEIN
ncbi:MAG: ROK family protein, partial [Spirochaetaceae bacterium]|nr:ROK family protein [Spirochaetaceae bacterium]